MQRAIIRLSRNHIRSFGGRTSRVSVISNPRITLHRPFLLQSRRFSKDESKEKWEYPGGLSEEEWKALPETEKLRLDPRLYESPLTDKDTEIDTDRLLDNAFVFNPQVHRHTLIWLHGIGKPKEETARGLEMILPSNTRLVVPAAPLIPITALGEFEERAWYDLTKDQVSEEDEEDRRGLLKSAEKVRRLVDEESLRVGSNKIFLGGFGQGGALAIHVGLAHPEKLGGIISYAGYISSPEELRIHPNNSSTPVVCLHGSKDRVVPWSFALKRYKKSLEASKTMANSVAFRLDPDADHFFAERLLAAMQAWMVQQFDNKK